MLISRSITTGKPIHFTSVQIGTYQAGDSEDLAKFTAVRQLFDSCEILGRSIDADGKMVLSAAYNNVNVKTSVNIYEIGVYANLDNTPGDTPVLFSYLTFGDNPTIILASDVQGTRRVFDIPYLFNDGDSPVVSIDPSTLVAKRETSDIAEPGKMVRVNEQGKLPVSITGDADTLDGKHASDFVPKERTVNGKSLSNDISLTPEDIGALATSYVMEKLYPVGSLWFNTRNISPADLLGFGSWERISGKYLFAADDTNTAGTSSGNTSVTITPSGSISANNGDTGSAGGGSTGSAGSGNTGEAGGGSTGAATGNTGASGTGATGKASGSTGNSTAFNTSSAGGQTSSKSGSATTSASGTGATGSAGGGNTGSTTLTSDQIPSHYHGFLDYWNTSNGTPGVNRMAVAVNGDGTGLSGAVTSNRTRTANTGGGNGHSHTLTAHTHTGPSHTHTIGDHTHTVSDHTHSVGAHSHSLNEHTHTGPSHTHSLNSHTHTVAAHTHTIGNHTHTVSEHTHTLGNHSHTFTGTAFTVNLTPVRYCVYVWRRTA